MINSISASTRASLYCEGCIDFHGTAVGKQFQNFDSNTLHISDHMFYKGETAQIMFHSERESAITVGQQRVILTKT